MLIPLFHDRDQAYHERMLFKQSIHTSKPISSATGQVPTGHSITASSPPSLCTAEI